MYSYGWGVFAVSLHLFPLYSWGKKKEGATANQCSVIGIGMKSRRGCIIHCHLYMYGNSSDL